MYKMHTLVIIFIFQVKQTQMMVSNTEIEIRQLNALSKIRPIKHQIDDLSERKNHHQEVNKRGKIMHLNARNHSNLFWKTVVKTTQDACPVVRKHRRKLTPHTAVYGIIFNLTVHQSVKQDTIDQPQIDYVCILYEN